MEKLAHELRSNTLSSADLVEHAGRSLACREGFTSLGPGSRLRAKVHGLRLTGESRKPSFWA